MDVEFITEKTTKLLAGLGDTCEAVRDTLVARGITGRTKAVDGCPVAVYLKSELRGYGVRVASEVQVWNTDLYRVYVTVPLPQAVETFIRAFDGQRYPELMNHLVEKISLVKTKKE